MRRTSMRDARVASIGRCGVVVGRRRRCARARRRPASSGGASTTVSPPARPSSTSRSSPSVRPSVSARCATLLVGDDERDVLAVARARSPSAGTSTPGAVGGCRPAGVACLEEAHAHAHVRHDARILHASSAMRTLTVALPRSAVGMIAITSAGDLPVRVGVERRLDRHLRLHAADERLADVDLDFQRIHVDDGADAGAGEAAAGRERRDDLARLRGLGDHHAGERRAHHGVVDALVGDAQLARRPPARCAARWRVARAARRARAIGLVVLRRRHELLPAPGRPGARHWPRLRAAAPARCRSGCARRRPARRRGRAAHRHRSDRAWPSPGRPRPAGLPRSAPRAPCR